MIEAQLMRAKKKPSVLVSYPPVEVAGATAVQDQGSLMLNLARIANSGAVVAQDATFGRCMSFNNTPGFISPAVKFDNSQPIIISFDVYIKARTNAVLITHVTWNSGGPSFGIQAIPDGRLQVYFNGGQRIWSTVVPLNTIAKVKLTIIDRVVSLYLDDVLQGTYTTPVWTEPSYPLGIGSAYEGTAGGFNGLIRNLVISQTA